MCELEQRGVAFRVLTGQGAQIDTSTQAALGKPETKVGALCKELGISSQTFYRHVAPDSSLRPDGQKLMEGHKST